MRKVEAEKGETGRRK